MLDFSVYHKSVNNRYANNISFIENESSKRLLSQLEFLKWEPKIILNLGSGNINSANHLKIRFPNAKIINIDNNKIVLEQNKSILKCDFNERLPFENNSIDLVFSNLAIQQGKNLNHIFSEIKRVLKHDSMVLASVFCERTLWQIAKSWESIDDFQHINQMFKAKDIADCLSNNRFDDIIMENDLIKLQYQNIKQAITDIREINDPLISSNRKQYMTTKSEYILFLNNFKALEKEISLDFDLLYLSAKFFNHSRNNLNPNNEVRINISSLMNKI